MLYIALSHYGKYKLGGNEAKTEFSTLSWMGMVFCGGIGGGIIYWSGVEWGYYVDETLFGITPYSEEAYACLLYTSPSPRDRTRSRMPSSA